MHLSGRRRPRPSTARDDCPKVLLASDQVRECVDVVEVLHTAGVWEGRIVGDSPWAGGWVMEIETNSGTVLAAQGSGCNLISHAVTQLPYCLIAAALAFAGFIGLAAMG